MDKIKLNVLLCTRSKLAYENAERIWKNNVNIVHYDGSIEFDENGMRALAEFKPDFIIGDIRFEDKLLHKKPSNYKIFQFIRKLSDNTALANIPVCLFSDFIRIKEVREEALKHSSVIGMQPHLPLFDDLKKYPRRLEK